MPKIHSTSLSNDYAAMRDDRRALNETNDCAVVALALVADVTYPVAHETLRQVGRKPRRGTYVVHTLEALKRLGKNYRMIMSRDLINTYPGVHKNLRHVTSHHPRRFPKTFSDNKTYLFVTSRHILAVKGNTVHDWSINKSLQVQTIYEIY